MPGLPRSLRLLRTSLCFAPLRDEAMAPRPASVSAPVSGSGTGAVTLVAPMPPVEPVALWYTSVAKYAFGLPPVVSRPKSAIGPRCGS